MCVLLADNYINTKLCNFFSDNVRFFFLQKTHFQLKNFVLVGNIVPEAIKHVKVLQFKTLYNYYILGTVKIQ